MKPGNEVSEHSVAIDSIPVSYQHPTSPYKHVQNKTFSNKKIKIDQTKQTTKD